MESTEAVTAVATRRLVAGRWCYRSALAIGVAVNAVEAYWLVEAIRQMIDGSCNAALTGLWFGAPLVPFAAILFSAGWFLARREDRMALRAGMLGLMMSLLAVPLWIAVGLVITMTFGLG